MRTERPTGTRPEYAFVGPGPSTSRLLRFDRVVQIAEGRVVDQGKVDELIGRQALFRELCFRVADNT